MNDTDEYLEKKWRERRREGRRRIFAFIIAAVVFFVSYAGLTESFEELRITTYIDYDEPVTITMGKGEYEASGTHTRAGEYCLFLSGMGAFWTYILLAHGKAKYSTKRDSVLWFIGATAAVVLWYAINALIPQKDLWWLVNAVWLVMCLAVLAGLMVWRENQAG